MDLGDDADILAACPRRRNDCLDAELHLLPTPDNPRIDKPDGSLAEPVGDRSREAEFDEWGQPIDPFRQAEVEHLRAQIGHAVFDGKAVLHLVRMALDVYEGVPGVGIDVEAAR